MKVIHINCPFGYVKDTVSMVKPLFGNKKVDYFFPEVVASILKKTTLKNASVAALTLYTAYNKKDIDSFIEEKQDCDYFVIIGPISKQININYSITVFPDLVQAQYGILSEKVDMELFVNPSDSNVIVSNYELLINELLKCLA